jgi:hypothetical protein
MRGSARTLNTASRIKPRMAMAKSEKRLAILFF